MTEINYAEAQEQDTHWRIKERAMMKRHLRERTQLLSKQLHYKIMLMVVKLNLPRLTEREVMAIELQLHSQMNLKSHQEVNCSLIGKQNEEDKKALKRKFSTDPKELIAERNGEATTRHQEATGPRRERTAPTKLQGE